ncbi:hypothetical protein I314_05397 [Cryptococcus bacillisporus CA1873]|uniref:Uncharacterized protein n=1 Tax=Cryptococcus bacillisporus CA1873 TaxID=1296111 RepID=A0ABR5B4Q3_CRYGA|nr:hypothetical protein I314_05397 [Cryptococcus bacillisporus CA1873]|eukprot:KIR58558.1 hypothetical protein I314_05397 [Cryptococcus gattii CA1873]
MNVTWRKRSSRTIPAPTAAFTLHSPKRSPRP